MQSNTFARQDGEEPDSATFQALKEFHSAGRGFWADVSETDWNDWRWQLKHRINSLEQLQRFLPTLTPEEYAGTLLANKKLALSIPPYFFNLIDPTDENCPIRRQVVPRIEETHTAPWEMSDPCGEDSHSPVPGLVHRYPDRVLFLVTDRCAAYCRYCTRSRLVSNAAGYDFHPEFDRQIEYVRQHPEIRDVLLSGGDPLLLGDEKLEYLLDRLRAIPHIEFLRIGTRIPIFLPQRITPALCAMLKKYHPLFISVHSNHPRELTTEVRDALGRLADARICRSACVLRVPCPPGCRAWIPATASTSRLASTTRRRRPGPPDGPPAVLCPHHRRGAREGPAVAERARCVPRRRFVELGARRAGAVHPGRLLHLRARPRAGG